MSKKVKSTSNIYDINQFVEPKKKFSVFDLYTINPLTSNQQKVFNSWKNGKNLFLGGSAGTGKTFLSLYLALDYVLDHSTPCKNIIIIRSVVQSREIGFLPGEEEEKLEPYETPYKTICDQLFKWKNSYDNLKRAGIIKFESTSFLRGNTFDNSVIIVDECSNCNFGECNTIATRCGMDSRIIYSGDIKQTDLNKRSDVSGFNQVVQIVDRIKSFDRIMFDTNDIVRSGFVKDWILACEELNF